MAQGQIILRAGDFRDPQVTIHRTAQAAIPRAAEVIAAPGDTLASITQRAYGHNSAAAQQRILAANSSLNGIVRAPR